MKTVYTTVAPVWVQSSSLSALSSSSQASNLTTGKNSVQSTSRQSAAGVHNDHANDVRIGMVQVISPIENAASSINPQLTWPSQNDINAHVHFAEMPTSFSLEVALESPYVFDIVGAKVSMKPSAYPVVSSALRLENDLEPPHPRQTAPPPGIFQTQVPASAEKMTNTAKSASPSASDPKHGHVHTKTETVVVVGSQIPKSEAINKSTIPSPPLLSDQQDLASVLSRSGIQLRLSNADNLTYATPTYFHATTPAPTPNHHDAGAFVPRSTSTNSTAHVDSASMPIYSTNPNEKRVTNGNGNNFAGNKPYKLADGFICLIIIGLVFILATLFYLFMRYRRRQRLRMAQGINGSSSSSKLMCGVADSPGPSSKQSSSSDEDRYQHRRPPVNEKRQRYVPDSGTELANRRNKPENNGEKAFRDSSTAAITMYPLQVPPKTRETEHERVIHIDEQDSYAAGKIDQAYIDYRTKGTVANAEKHEDMRLVKAQTKEPSASNGTRWVEPKHESENNSANKNIRALREPAKVLLPSSENRIHNASSPESKLPEIRLCTPDKSKAGSGNNKERSAAQNEPATGSSNKAKKRHALLDTSSVNPGIMSPLKSDELQGQLQKPRKLVRGSTKRDKRSSGSLGKDVDDDSKKRSRSTDHHNSNLSLRAMFRAPQPCQKDSRKEKETRQRDHSHGADSSDSDTDRKDVEEKRRGEQLLTDSIESISDNYQLAVRHKPPLGPLRAVEPHVPVLPDELVVERSDRMYVFGEFADGWVLAMNISRRSDLGMVPRRCMFFPTAPFMTEEAIMASHASTNPEEV